MAAEEQNQDIIEKGKMLACTASFDFAGIERDMEMASFINKLITTVHAVQYNPACDGDVHTYAIRTNKILTISNGIAAMINSVPAMISEDLSKLDFAGLMGCLPKCFSFCKVLDRSKIKLSCVCI